MVLDHHDQIVGDLVARNGGSSIKHTGDGFRATFPRPSSAVACGLAILDVLGRIRVPARVGAHVGEIEVRNNGDITGVTVNLAARVAMHADAGEFLVSVTLRDTMLGSDTAFHDRGYWELAGIGQLWQLYSVPRLTANTESDVDDDLVYTACAALDSRLHDDTELERAQVR